MNEKKQGQVKKKVDRNRNANWCAVKSYHYAKLLVDLPLQVRIEGDSSNVEEGKLTCG